MLEKTSDGFQNQHGNFGFGVRNAEGEKVLEFAEAANMYVVNTSFIKPMKYRATYRSNQHETQVDYILVPVGEKAKVRNCKAVTEECAKQHSLVVMYWKLQPMKKPKQVKVEKIKLWRLKDKLIQQQFEAEMSHQLINLETEVDVENKWTMFRDTLMNAAKKTCGVTKGSTRVDRKSWMWSEQVKEAVKDVGDGWKVETGSISGSSVRLQVVGGHVDLAAISLTLFLYLEYY